MGNIDISVIIPVFNRENHIQKCLDSVLGQNGVTVEVIIIDDGSTDNSLEICQQYAAEYSNIIVIHQTNKGIASSRNAGVDIAIGDYITFLDSDDYITPNAFIYMLSAMKEKDVDVVIGGFDRVTENGELIERNNIPYDYKDRIISRRDYWYLNSLKQSNYLFTVIWGKLYKRSIWIELRFEDGQRFAEDEYILPKLIERCNSFYLMDDIVYEQTSSIGSLTRSRFDASKLGSPESKLITSQFLIKENLYDCAVEKWGIAIGEIIIMTKFVDDDESRKKISNINVDAKRLGIKLFKYMDPIKRLKYIGYLIGDPIYRLSIFVKTHLYKHVKV